MTKHTFITDNGDALDRLAYGTDDGVAYLTIAELDRLQALADLVPNLVEALEELRSKPTQWSRNGYNKAWEIRHEQTLAEARRVMEEDNKNVRKEVNNSMG